MGSFPGEIQSSHLPHLHISSPPTPKICAMGNCGSQYFVVVIVFIAALNVWKAPDGYPAAEHRAWLFNMLPEPMQDAYFAATLANMSSVSPKFLASSIPTVKGPRLIDGSSSSLTLVMTGCRQPSSR